MDIVVASNNKNKLVEIRAILGGRFEKIYSLSDLGLEIDVDEDKDTFLGNAHKKAFEVAKLAKMTALSDDSGIVVDALSGAPGVYSARYAGEGATDAKNNALLLRNLEGVSNRSASFVSAVVLCEPNGDYVFGEGRVFGEVLTAERGENGFGYDPLFFATEIGTTFAEASHEEKNAISHRKRALEELLKKL